MVHESFDHIGHHQSPAEDHVEDEQEQQLGHRSYPVNKHGVHNGGRGWKFC